MAWRSRMSYRGGWALTATREVPDVTMPGVPVWIAGAVHYTLDGLLVTRDQAEAIMSARPGGITARAPRCDVWPGDPPRYVLDGIDLTQEEAAAVHEGRDPLAVLLPRLTIRALTAQELEEL